MKFMLMWKYLNSSIWITSSRSPPQLPSQTASSFQTNFVSWISVFISSIIRSKSDENWTHFTSTFCHFGKNVGKFTSAYNMCNASKCIKMYWNALKHVDKCQNGSKYVITYQNASKRIKMHQSTSMGQNMYNVWQVWAPGS